MLILRGQPDTARKVLERIYPSAYPSQLERKVNEMVDSVKFDNTAEQASLKQKFHKLLYIGSNRRALGQYLLSFQVSS